MMVGRKKIRRRGAKSEPNEKKMYFGPEVTEAISSYNYMSDEGEKIKIYKSVISPALMKLAESLILIYGFSEPGEDMIEIQLDCVAFLYENLRKFDSTRGTKAFSYFNVIARNWLIQNSRKRTTAGQRNVSIEDITSLSGKDRNAIAYHKISESPDESMIQANQKNHIKFVLEKINRRLIDENEKI